MRMSLRGAVRIVADPAQCKMSDQAVFVALADTVMPHGPMPTLGAHTLGPTPVGTVPISNIKAGWLITTATGVTAQVRWAGAVGQLTNGIMRQTSKRPSTQTYRQIMLDWPQLIASGGLTLDTFFADAVLKDAQLRQYSVLVNLPAEVLRTQAAL